MWFSNSDDEKLGVESIAWRAILFAILTLVAWIENMLIIALLVKYKTIRNNTTLIMGSLAVADIFKCTTQAISGMNRALSRGNDYALGNFWCMNEHLVKGLFYFAMQYNIVALVLNRLAFLIRGYRSEVAVSIKYSVISIAVIWITATIDSVMNKLYAMHCSIKEKEGKSYCNEQDVAPIEYWISRVIYIVYVPLAALMLLYVTVLYLKIRSRGAHLEATAPMNLDPRRHTVKMSVLLCYVVLAFLMNLPLHIWFINAIEGKRKGHPIDTHGTGSTVYALNHFFQCLESCLNPLLFAFQSATIRYAFRDMLFPRRTESESTPLHSTFD